MAELKKCVIKKAIRSIEKSYDYHSYNGKYDVLVDLDELVDLIANMSMPTTTESEIRAKAIDEFAEKLIAHFTDWAYQEAPANDDETDRTRHIICDTIHEAMAGVDEIAEQLKGE